MSTASSGAGTSRSATKRLLKELDTWHQEKVSEKGVERLGPVGEEDLFTWQAVINGHDIGSGYSSGRWLLLIKIPPQYPLHPPSITFSTPIIHPNIALNNGEICLDLLKEAWTPAYSVLESVRAVRMLLTCPEVDSPLNVDVASLLRAGDEVGTRRLVEFWCQDDEGRYDGP